MWKKILYFIQCFVALFFPCLSLAEVQMDRYLDGIYITSFVTEGDSIWCATWNSGIVLFNMKSHAKTFLTPENVVPAEHFNSVAIDRNGVKWFGADKTGIYRYDGNSWQRFLGETALIDVNRPGEDLTVMDIAVDNLN